MKNNRQESLLEIIKNEVCVTQDELQEKLTALGFQVTQSTVSRDIKQLRIIKALDSQGNYRYMAPVQQAKENRPHSDEQYSNFFHNATVSVDYAMNNVVVKCYPGMASSACVAVERLFQNEIVGSLAGDDTIFIITKTVESAERLTANIRKLLG